MRYHSLLGPAKVPPNSLGQRHYFAKRSSGLLGLSSTGSQCPCYRTQRRTGQWPRFADATNTPISTKLVLGADCPSGHETIDLSVIIPNLPKLPLQNAHPRVLVDPKGRTGGLDETIPAAFGQYIFNLLPKGSWVLDRS